MIFKTPAFWYRDQSKAAPLAEKLLRPLSCVYAGGHVLNQALQKTHKINTPIICIGNLTAGGSGKTPVALSLMNLVKKNTIAPKPHFLTRGYGGKDQGPLLFDPRRHNALECGDEALLLARTAPTVVAHDRVGGGRFAAEQGAGLLIMDDGLQNSSIFKDMSIIVINGTMGFGNERLLPAGPLREPLQSGLEKADAFVLIGEDQRGILDTLPNRPVFKAAFATDEKTLPDKNIPYIAFAGLGYPDKFFTYLKTLGYTLLEEIIFADHHAYNEHDLYELHTKAKNNKAQLITTEKDFARLPASLDFQIDVLPITLSWHNEADLIAFIKNHPALQSS